MSRTVIVAGVARAGKTTLASRLATAGFNSIPGDAIVSSFQAVYPEIGIGHEGSDRDKAKVFLPWLSAFTSRLCKLDRDYVLDTAKLLPEDAPKLMSDLNAQVVFLGFPQVGRSAKLQAIRLHPDSDKDWTIGVPDPLLLEMIDGMIGYSQKLEAQCRQYGVPFVDTGVDFTGAVERTFRQLTGTVDDPAPL